MVRLTAAQARRMGIKLPDDKAKTRKEGSRGKGRDRLERAAYGSEAIVFTMPLPFDPKPKERPRTVVNMNSLRNAFLSARGNLQAFMKAVSSGISHTYTPQATSDYEKLVADAAKSAMAGREPFNCPVETSVMFVLSGDPSSWPTSRLDGDADNLEKAVLDALNGVVFEDDRLVVRSYREKSCGHKPELTVRVAPASP